MINILDLSCVLHSNSKVSFVLVLVFCFFFFFLREERLLRQIKTGRLILKFRLLEIMLLFLLHANLFCVMAEVPRQLHQDHC